jgi:CheY-like chemotaxis protein
MNAAVAFARSFMPSLSNSPRPFPWTQRRVILDGAVLRVLIVDDNQNAAEALAAYFANERMECRVAFGGVQAIAEGGAWSPHVIVMDISMPGCNGLKPLVLCGTIEKPVESQFSPSLRSMKRKYVVISSTTNLTAIVRRASLQPIFLHLWLASQPI